jgi:hypothetical protein
LENQNTKEVVLPSLEKENSINDLALSNKKLTKEEALEIRK